MRHRPYFIVVLFAAVIVIYSLVRFGPFGSIKRYGSTSAINELMRIESPAFAMGEPIPQEYSCDGRNVNPPLRLVGVPEKTQSLVIIVDDPDAPLGTWTHWTVWNLAANVTDLAADWRPAGSEVQGLTSFGRSGWGGPCPPSGTHRYFFKVFALDVFLPLGPSADIRELEDAMRPHILDKAGVFGTYSR